MIFICLQGLYSLHFDQKFFFGGGFNLIRRSRACGTLRLLTQADLLILLKVLHRRFSPMPRGGFNGIRQTRACGAFRLAHIVEGPASQASSQPVK